MANRLAMDAELMRPARQRTQLETRAVTIARKHAPLRHRRAPVLGVHDLSRRVVEILDGLGLAGQKVLIVIDEANPRVERSARNIHGVGVIRAPGLNVYDVLRHDKLVMTRAALSAVEQRLGDAGREEQS